MKNDKTVNPEIGRLFGKMYSFNESLKLFHWQDKGEGSYARHMATDQALDSVRDILDRLVETTYSAQGEVNIIIPETAVPECLTKAICALDQVVEEGKKLFPEEFLQSILDEYREALHQLNYRITRLS